MKLFIVINEDCFFLSHRLPLAKAAIEKGYDVTLIAKDTGRKQEVLDAGVKFLDFPVNPTGMSPKQELKTLRWLIKLFRSEWPDVIHLVGLKCMLWGALAGKLTRVPVVINAVSGLGVLFSDENLGVVPRTMLAIQRFSNRRKNAFLIFQNNEDKALLAKYRVMKEDQCRFIKGSGVDLSEYCYTPEPEDGKVIVIYTARMVREKGICDLAGAAGLLKGEYEGTAEFWLCGGLHANPKALKEDEVRAMCDGDYIQWLGFRKDVCDLLKKSHIVAFPSYYREGVPKSLIEASAVGRPIITCDSVGCKDVVEDGVNGFLIQPKDVQDLADRLKQLIDSPALRKSMGFKSREFAERDFSIEGVVEKHMELYKLGEHR